MNWSKYSIENRMIPGISTLAVVFMIISLYLHSKLVMFLACFFLILVAANQYYLKKVGIGLMYTNRAEKKQFFINENGKWTITFRNNGYPILRGEVRVYFDDYVRPLGDDLEPKQSMYELVIPVSLLTKQSKQISIPYQSKKRGIAKIRRMEFRIPSLIGFGESVLEYKEMIKQEAVVYPNPILVRGLNDYLSINQGGNSVPYSVYEDRLGPLGTRDYTPTDSFNRIHWKATARKQTLQTKIFERISEKGWNLSINVSDGYAITGLLEQILSSITEFAYYAEKKQIPYSLCINVRTAGNTPFYFVPKGEGKEHLQRILETLSSINGLHTIYPYEKMISFFLDHLSGLPNFLHGGNRNTTVNTMLYQLGGKGINLFELLIEENEGSIKRLNFQKEGRMLI